MSDAPDYNNDTEECLSEEEVEELMVRTSRKQVRSDYRRSLGSEASRRYCDLNTGKD
ncbi:hypothetical protein [Methanohalophilus mahii]|uniref:Uncharacterized protein n=1 Tax=Methanohalophilus mahii (strain ATCC 35705 / DSM 5219 / SLP) TaxID=547558 RepID=D5E957_METMS|nr:hypothetical protein [Methanohalophilus mahii]ADE35708.1 hypothetical protein Mmah_0173 [Methanohalophilus mahii DSM 5219]